MPSPKPTHDEIVQAHINDLKATINGLENKIRRMTQIIISGDERQQELEKQLKEKEITK
jgi:hypothetical protein